ncbi:MAG TPA: Asp-tRNA(Asn)/Glu-tRNA(Gln) amidotransferase subunit GatB [Patescibacteria group bacterium]|nr:Asp-tRNA(Asn)/Glu-tRNA(Gln) amidotransferase subunit GatB [Patescibacteria group bacterium]
MNYKPVIGLEVHIELKTKSKMFCSCSADYFGKKPNSHTCPVCLGLPGALPVPNKTAIEWCLRIGSALNCSLLEFSKFDRKNYFYPDLAKGYQISQYDKPFCKNGEIEINNKKIGITRVHMEEDTGKLIHASIRGEKMSLIDFNRSGVPLVEIVTEPEFENANEVTTYLKKLQQIVRYLNVSNADMDKGDMRLEPNISLIKNGEKSLPKYKVEVKNINSFKFVKKAIEYETKRQLEILKKGEIPVQETRGWDENKQKTTSQRVKEEANDYRYFPEPDIPPLRFEKDYLNKIKNTLLEFADQKTERFIKEYSISKYDAEILTREKITADFFEETVKLSKKHDISGKKIANEIINKKINILEILPAKLIQTILNSNKKTVIDEIELITSINKVLKENSKAVADYKSGKIQVIGFLIGSIIKDIGKPIDTYIIKEILEKELKNG